MNRHMSFLYGGRNDRRAVDRGTPDRRMAERFPVDQAAVVRQVVARNQPRPLAFPATIIDVSAKGAAIRVGLDVDLVPHRAVELGIDGAWSRTRVVWSRVGLDGMRLGGLEFTEAFPEFLPALARWLDRHAYA